MSKGPTLERFLEVMCGITEIPTHTEEEWAHIHRNHMELVRLGEFNLTAKDWDEYEELCTLHRKDRTAEENERYEVLYHKLIHEGPFNPEFL